MKAPLALLSVTLVISATAAEAPEVTDEVLRAYQEMHKMNAEPRPVATQFAALCGYNAASAEAMKLYGPHYGYWINVFMNEPARKHFESKSTKAYPPGSIVVKEKLSGRPSDKAKPQTTAIAGQIKHAPGYNPATGDWEFFFSPVAGKMDRGTTGKLSSCGDCHQNAGPDYVFGDFALARPPAQF